MTAEILLIVLLVALVTIALPFGCRRVLLGRLARSLQQKRFDEFLRRIDGPLCRVVFSAYEREYFRLNAFSLQGDPARTDEQYQKLLGMKLRSLQQEKNLVLNAFSYYLNAGNAPRTTALLPRLKEAVGAEEYRIYEMMYSVAIRKEANYISEMEQRLAGAGKLDQSVLHYMLSLQYGYRGDTEKAQEHLRRSKACSEQALAGSAAQA